MSALDELITKTNALPNGTKISANKCPEKPPVQTSYEAVKEESWKGLNGPIFDRIIVEYPATKKSAKLVQLVTMRNGESKYISPEDFYGQADQINTYEVCSKLGIEANTVHSKHQDRFSSVARRIRY